MDPPTQGAGSVRGSSRKRPRIEGSGRLGRPSTAAKIWDNPKMARSLVNLRYCTNLSNEVIGHILSGMANRKTSVDGERLQSLETSTRMQLARLQAQSAKPKSEGAAKSRAQWMRLNRTFQRDILSEPNVPGDHISVIDSMEDAILELHNKILGRIERPFLTGMPLQSPRSTASPSMADHGEQTVLDASLKDWDKDKVFADIDKLIQRVTHRIGSRASSDSSDDWLLKAIWSRRSSIRQITTSVSDIKSLLSYSTKSAQSRHSRGLDSSNDKDDFAIHHLPRLETKSMQNEFYIKVCCRYRSTCLHRKVATILERPDCLGSTYEPFEKRDFHCKHGRDMFNNTALHIAALWSAPFHVIHKLVSLSCAELLSVTNIAGNTFMHILGRQWLLANPKALLSLVTAVGEKEFSWAQCNHRGENFLASLIREDDFPWTLVFERPRELDLVAIDTSIYPHGMDFPCDRATGPHAVRIFQGFKTLLHMKPEHLKRSLCQPSVNVPGVVGEQLFAYLHGKKQLWGEEYRYADEDGDMLQVISSYNHNMSDIPLLNPLWQKRAWNPSFNSLPQHNLETLQQWFKAGGNPNIYWQHGYPLLQIESVGKPLVVAIIDEVQSGTLMEADVLGILNLLDSDQVDLDLADLNGNTSLHHAADYGLADIVGKLVSLGANVCARNADRETPIDFAVRKMAGSKINGDSVHYSTMTRIFMHMVDKLPLLSQSKNRNSVVVKGAAANFADTTSSTLDTNQTSIPTLETETKTYERHVSVIPEDALSKVNVDTALDGWNVQSAPPSSSNSLPPQSIVLEGGYGSEDDYIPFTDADFSKLADLAWP